MKRIFYVFGLLLCCLQIQAQENLNTSEKVMLPNGWALSPAGESLPLGDLPLNMAISKSKKWMAVTNNGQSTQTIQLINTLTDKIEDNIVVDKAWLGLAFSKDEKYLYASGGNDNWILQYAITGNKLKLLDSIKLGDKWPNKISPAGICIDDNNVLFVVTKDDNALYSINLNSKKVIAKVNLPAEAYTCILSSNKKGQSC